MRQHLSLETSVLLIALSLSLPVVIIIGFLFVPATEVWQHLVDTVLADYITNSLFLMFGVAVGTLLIGTSLAWLTVMCHFPGRAIFEWALLLPLAMPAYIIAYTYTGMLDFSGPVQTTIRAMTGLGYGDYWFPEVRSIYGAMLMLSLVLYPYVYLLTRAAFLNQSICVLDVSRSMGMNTWQCFYRVALPLARPAIIAGLSLVLMETLADFGTVQYFGVQTFTTGIYRTWFGLDDLSAAAQLSAILLLFIFLLITLEHYQRRQAKYHHTSQRHQSIQRIHLSKMQSLIASLSCLFILALGFLLPVSQLALWSITISEELLDASFFTLVQNSLLLAAATAFIAVILAMLLGYGARLIKALPVKVAVFITSLGYAVPGAVIAVGVLLPFSVLDQWFSALMQSYFGIETGLLFSGTVFVLIFAYLVRFLPISLKTVTAGLGRIKLSMDESAQTFGLNNRQIIQRVHLPLLKGSVLTAVLLVFVDVLKELPATLILRPFNFNTLAVRAYELASDERLADAAPAALMIVVAGIIPVIMLSYSISRSRDVTT